MAVYNLPLAISHCSIVGQSNNEKSEQCLGCSKSAKPHTLTIEGVGEFTVNPKETILTAALRQGVRFPYSCKVGGCATCKCKLQDGQVKELTSSAFILSSEDLDNKYILGCQSQLKSDVTCFC